MSKYLISALVTTYNSERFMRGLLEDLEAQTIADRLEIVIVDSNSPQNERAIIEEYQKKYDNIVYVRTEKRETSHAAWNRCIDMARGKYLSMACTDDRHRPDAYELMVKALEEYPEYGLVYADSLITEVENETFAKNSANTRYDWPDYNLGTHLSSCIIGPHPVWRAAVHQQAGGFDPDIWIAGDQDLYLRIAWYYGAVHLRETLGLFLSRPDSNSGKNHSQEVVQDVLRVMRDYREAIPIERVYPKLKSFQNDPEALAAALWYFGNLCALSPYNDFELTVKNYEKAVRVEGLSPQIMQRLETMLLNNVGAFCYTIGEKKRGLDYLTQSKGVPAAQHNLQLIERLQRSGRPAILLDFQMLHLKHPVVEDACKARGLRLDENCKLVKTEIHEQLFWDVYSGPNGVPASETEKNIAAAQKPRITKVREAETDLIVESQVQSCADDSLPEQSNSLQKPAKEKSLHIVITMYGWDDEGGGTIHPRQVAKGLVECGHQVSVIYTPPVEKPQKSAYYLEESQDDGVRLFAIYNRPVLFQDLQHPERELHDAQMSRIVSRLLFDLKPDLVYYASFLNFSMAVPAEVHRLGIPSVSTTYNYWPICPRLYLYRQNLELCDGPSPDGSKCAACLGNFSSTEDYARRARGGRKMLTTHIGRLLAVSHRVREIYLANGYDAAPIEVLHQPSRTTDAIWRQVGQGRKPEAALSRPLRIGFVGTIIPHKGVHTFVEALQTFERERIEAHIYGAAVEPYGQSVRHLDRFKSVKFHGRYPLEELPSILSRLDIIVVPSVTEDCAPFVVQEALAARCPVLGAKIGGIPEFIEHGRTGFHFEAGNAMDLADRIRRFTDRPRLLGEMQANITQPKSFGKYLEELTAHFTQVIAAGPRPQNNPREASVASQTRRQEKEVGSVRKIRKTKSSALHESPRFSIVWEGPQFAYHSLALINRELCIRLKAAGHELSILPVESDADGPVAAEHLRALLDQIRAPLKGIPDVHVRHQWPPNLQPPPDGHWIIIQPWEFGSLPVEWSRVFATQVDEMWVPSTYVRQVFIDSGVPADRVYVVSNGINPDRFHPAVTPLRLKTRRKFKFLFVGGTLDRKGIQFLLAAYLQGFKKSDDVCLVIKDMGGSSFYKGKTFAGEINRIRGKRANPDIEYLEGTLSENEIPGLYSACDVLVQPYRGEGFGLPILEAMACGVPAIVTNGGACLDFCNENNALLVKADKRRFSRKQVAHLQTVDFPWLYDVDVDDLTEKMLIAFHNPEQMIELGKRAAQDVLKGFTWQESAKTIQNRIRELRAKRIRRHTLDSGASRWAQDQDVDLKMHRSAGVPWEQTSIDSNSSLVGELVSKARRLIENNHLKDGLTVLSQVLDLAPQYFEALVLMGDVFEQLGQHDSARKMWELASQQRPNEGELKKRLAELLIPNTNVDIRAAPSPGK